MATDAGGSGGDSPLKARLFFAMKTIELVLSVVGVGLAIDPLRAIVETGVVHAGLALTAYSSAIIASTIMILGRLVREPLPPRPTLLFLLVNGSLLVAAGGVLIADWCRVYYRTYNLRPKLFLDSLIASGIIAIFDATAHFTDVGLTLALS